jgi:diguanylate cyclase (GGDEF)-like protein
MFEGVRWLTLIGLCIGLGVLVSGAAIVMELRIEAWHRAEQEATERVDALSRDIARAITLYDNSLKAVRDVMQRPDIAKLSPETRRLTLFNSSASTEALGAMLVLDAQGTTIADTRSANAPPINMADRDFFTAQRDHADLGLFISRPYQSKLRQGDWSIAIGRRITGPDGGFGGIVSGALRLAWFQDMFQRIDVRPHGTITLFQADGRVVMRLPSPDSEIDRDRSGDPLFRQFASTASGHLTSEESDGDRLYVFDHVGALPLILSVGLAVDDIYAPWRRTATVIGVAMAVLGGGSVGVCLLYSQTIRRRNVADAMLREEAGRLEVIAATDALTGLANRRAFDTTLSKEWRLAIRNETPIALLMLDADYFKRYNDHYGHPKGDSVLRAIASCIRDNLKRPSDLGARVGGEEFAGLMPGTEVVGAIEVAERIRQSIANLNIAHTGNPAGHVTVSVGCAVLWPSIGDTEMSLVALADKALYDAKNAGRNRVHMPPGSDAGGGIVAVGADRE